MKGTVEYANRKEPRFKNKKPHIIISPFEHHCVLDTAKYLEKTEQVEVSWLSLDEYGLVDPSKVAELIKDETVLVSVMYVNNEVGTIQPIKKISKIIGTRNSETGNRNRILFHSDSVQAIEYLNCNVQELGVDMLSLSAHKFHGPKGIGALYIREGTKLIPQIHGGAQEYNMRAGTENVPYIVGLGKAVDLVKRSPKETTLGCDLPTQGWGNSDSVTKLRNKLIDGILNTIPNAKLTGHPEKRAPHIASFVFSNVEGEAMLLHLDREGIAASSGSACTSGELKPSHVLLAMGVPQEVAHSSLRLSLSKYTTEKEIGYVLEKLPPIIEKLKSMSPT